MYKRQFNLLVVEEDALTLFQTVTPLQQRDYVVFGAPDVETAVSILSRWSIDLLVTGLTLRERSGFDLLAHARQQQPALAAVVVGHGADSALVAHAARHDAALLVRPLDPALLLMVVAEKLAAVHRVQRWPRKHVNSDVPVSVDGAPARLLDVSYGGLRLALRNDRFELTSPMNVAFPGAGFAVKAHLVWSTLAGDGVTCVCGAAIAEDVPMTHWRRFVDWIPNAA